jgi:uncharacterized protein YecT (DUF1311 family)
VTLSPDLLPPEASWLGRRYEFLSELGRGGMAVVYLARDRESGEEVAIKLVAARYAGDEEAVRRFAREARTVAGLRHPNLVRTLSVEELDGRASAIVNEYVRGRTLRAVLRAVPGPLPFDSALRVLRDVAAGLAHAHAARIVHRDVKPENIFLEDATDRALLADFGIARPLDVDSQLTIAGAALGTPSYMAPEQVDGRTADERADVYALGLVGWEMLSGRRPWQGESLYAVLHKQKHEPLPSLAALRPDIPAFLLAALDGALAKDPAERWRDASEFLARLTPQPLVLPEPTSDALVDATTMRRVEPAPPSAVPRPVVRGGRRAPLLVALAGTAALALLLVRAGGGAPASTRLDVPPPAPRDRVLDSLLAVASGQAWVDTAARDSAARTVGSAAGDVRLGTVPNAAARADSVAAPTKAAATRPTTLAARCASPASDDQRRCLLGRLAETDARMTSVYQQVIASYRSAAGGAREPASVRALRAEQRQWLVSRDRLCRARTRGTEGELWGAARVPCFAEMARLRATALSQRLPAGAAAPRRRVGTGEEL